MKQSGPRSEFSDVDNARIPSDYVKMLDAQRFMLFNQQYKQQLRVLLDLHPGLQVLDAGAGTGEDAQEVANLVAPGGQVVGSDLSIEGMRLAQEHNIVTAEEAERWIVYLEEAMRTGRFFHAMTWFITIGSKP